MWRDSSYTACTVAWNVLLEVIACAVSHITFNNWAASKLGVEVDRLARNATGFRWSGCCRWRRNDARTARASACAVPALSALRVVGLGRSGCSDRDDPQGTGRRGALDLA